MIIKQVYTPPENITGIMVLEAKEKYLKAKNYYEDSSVWFDLWLEYCIINDIFRHGRLS